MTTQSKTLVVFIPAFNEDRSIAATISAVPRSLPGIDKVSIVVVDDGSTDDTANAATAAGATVISHGRNLGLADAFRTGIRACLQLHATLAVSIDADLQFDPEDIRHLVVPVLNDEADFVVGDRFSDSGRPAHMPAVKYVGNKLMTWAVNRLARTDFSDVSSGYRVYSREALLHLNVQSSFTYTQESFIELAAKGLRIQQLPVRIRYFEDRKSRISSNLVRYGLRTGLTILRTTRDYAPFNVFGTLALMFAIPGFLSGIFVLAHYLTYGSFSPYIFLAFSAAYLVSVALALLVLALVADMLRGVRTNQERLLYFAKLSHYQYHAENEAESRTGLSE